jgi:hypothetical protein
MTAANYNAFMRALMYSSFQNTIVEFLTNLLSKATKGSQYYKDYIEYINIAQENAMYLRSKLPNLYDAAGPSVRIT